MILALDLGTTTGYAFSHKKGFKSGVLNFKVNGKFHDSGFRLLLEFLKGFLEGPHEHPNFEIVLETPHGGYFNSMRILFGLMAIVHLFGDMFKIKICWVSPKAIKRYWVGKGNASKDDMMKRTTRDYPKITDNNEGDAVALFFYHKETIGGRVENS